MGTQSGKESLSGSVTLCGFAILQGLFLFLLGQFSSQKTDALPRHNPAVFI